jgi:SAM-dependent methyltransferase
MRSIRRNQGGKWNNPLGLLSQKWHEVPILEGRASTLDLLELSDGDLMDLWEETRRREESGPNFEMRGWYRLLYSDAVKAKRLIDVGSGFGLDGITFTESGAHVTFLDVAESNIQLIQRICNLRSLTNVAFVHLQDFQTLNDLSDDFDIIWCLGSLLHAPYEVVREERQLLTQRLKIGGRWIELGYPRSRWEREGSLPFDRWGKKTDGEATPWAEWYDLSKLISSLLPAKFEPVLTFEFNNSNFVWFDLIRRS